MTPKTLYGRLFLIILAFGIAMTAVFLVVLLGYHEHYHVEAEQTINSNLASQYANARLLISDRPLTAGNFHEGLRKLAQLNPDVDIYLLDDRGDIVASTLKRDSLRRRRVDMAAVHDFLGKRRSFPILGDDPQTLTGRQIFSAASVAIADCPAKFIYVVLHREASISAAAPLWRAYTARESLLMLVALVALGTIATLLITQFLTRRLTRLQGEIEQFAMATAGPPSAESLGHISDLRGDDIDRLTSAFRQLAGTIHQQVEQLRSSEQLRRTFLANVSHDLKTPLSTIQVALEGIAHDRDGDGDAHDRSAYDAQIALNECRRLAALVDQLLELASLDASQVARHDEPFHIADLLQDVAQKYEMLQRNSRVAVYAEYDRDLPLVFADIDLIERVLSNLVDNALRYSPPEGAVRIRASLARDHAVLVEVLDSGPGIPPAERAAVFERFYRGPAAGNCSRGSGLGLSIVKGILDMYGATISVEPANGGGSRFSFQLKVAKAPRAER